MPTAAPVTLTVSHPSSLSPAEVLDIVNNTVDTDAPLVIQALPVSAATANRVTAYATLGEIGLAIVNQIVQAIHAARAAKQAPPPTSIQG